MVLAGACCWCWCGRAGGGGGGEVCCVCLSGRRLLLLAVRRGGCWLGVMDGWPMLLTSPSSRLWNPLAALLLLWTEPMRWRAPGSPPCSRAVLRSSSVRVRGRLVSPLTPRAPCLLLLV